LRFYTDEDKENCFQACLIILNTYSFDLKLHANGIYATSGGSSTLIGGSPDVMQAEGVFGKFMTQPKLHVVVTGDILTISNANGGDRLVWKRVYFTPEIVTENPFAPIPPWK